MDVKPENAIRLLRNRDVSILEDYIQREVLSLFNNDNTKPSQNVRVILALNIQTCSMVLKKPELQSLAMDILFGSNKKYIIETLDHVKKLLLDYTD